MPSRNRGSTEFISSVIAREIGRIMTSSQCKQYLTDRLPQGRIVCVSYIGIS